MPIIADDQTAYFTVIHWPGAMDRDTVVQKISKRTGLDETSLRLSARKAAPCIIGLFPIYVARNAAETVVECGGDAFTTTLSAIEALGKTHKIKDMRLTKGAFEAELWRGGPVLLKPADVSVLIRARISEARKPESFTPGSAQGGWANLGRPQPFAMYWGPWGSYGTATVFAGDLLNELGDTPVVAEVVRHEKLDIHLNDGRVFQIDGDKFGFQILGELRGLSDNVNIDRMCELFTHMAPDAVVDPYFSLWKAPMSVKQLRLPQMKVNNDDPAFAYYSRWAALMYRQILDA